MNFERLGARLCAAAALGVAFAGSAVAQNTAKPTKAADISVDTFFKRAEYAQMSISPDGKLLAALSPRGGKNNLVIVNLATRAVTAITSFTENDVVDFRWIDSTRIYFRAASNIDITGRVTYAGAYAIDVDGKNMRDLTFPTRRGVSGTGSTRAGFRILSRTYDGTGELIVSMNERVREFSDVYRYDTRTGNFKLLTFDSPGRVTGWLLDRDLIPRIAIRSEERESPDKPRFTTIWHRAGDGKPWEKIGQASSRDDDGSIIPIGFDFDNQTLYVSSNVGRDKRAIYKYDIANKKLGEQLVQHPMIDLQGGLLFSRAKKALVGLRYDADKEDTVWFSKEYAELQAMIDKALPNTVNIFDLGDETAKNILVYAYSDTNPGEYYLLDAASRKLEQVATTRSWLPPALMGERRFIKYKTRDGMEIPAWVTLPRGSSGKNLPLIVNIHGGPHLRGYSWAEWGRWPEAQFFASRGYVVLEPEPRGSRGFGREHYRSSFKQWGLTMQDDITDGALHLVNEGIVDKKRMCLHGGSYGGYATLQGLVKDPDLWRCGSPLVAVTDLFLLYEANSDTRMYSDYLETDAKRIIGDPKADAAQFEKTSPARNASRIQAPVLLAMGVEDQRVPLVHGKVMRDALEKAGKKVEYVQYEQEGHGFVRHKNIVDFYTRLEKFFAEHLK
jgi:dipeptidyl aminopeptidase/acylaminoacyl peptidase